MIEMKGLSGVFQSGINRATTRSTSAVAHVSPADALEVQNEYLQYWKKNFLSSQSYTDEGDKDGCTCRAIIGKTSS
jgi:hypothetical protein